MAESAEPLPPALTLSRHASEDDSIAGPGYEDLFLPQHPPSPWSGPRMHGIEPDDDEPFSLLPPAQQHEGAHEAGAEHDEHDECGTQHSSGSAAPSERVLGVVAVAMISFFNVSGGPIGSEEIVANGGPLIGLSSLCAMWLVFSIPQALITAELSSAFPHNGGYSLWVEAAFGRFWGIQESYWSWCSGVVDNALYPVLLYSTLTAMIGGSWDNLINGGDDDDDDGSAGGAGGGAGLGEEPTDLWACIGTWQCARAYLIKAAITALFTLPNVVSVNLVGRGLQAMCALVLAPYAALCGLALSRAEPSRWLARPRSGRVKWTALLSCVYWNVSGWDCASTFAGEVKDPGRTYPRGLGAALVLMLLAYALPLLAASGTALGGDWSEWREGSFSQVASGIGGRWLGMWVVASSALGNWGLFASELLEDSYQLLGMAEAGMAPSFFGRRHARFHTPVNAIVLQLAIILVLIGFDFDAILAVDNFFSATQATLEFAAAVKLRSSHAHLPRPFRIGVSTGGLALLLAAPTVLSVATAVMCVTSSVFSAATTALACLGGCALYFALEGRCCPQWLLTPVGRRRHRRRSSSGGGGQHGGGGAHGAQHAHGAAAEPGSASLRPNAIEAYADPTGLHARLLDHDAHSQFLAVPNGGGARPRRAERASAADAAERGGGGSGGGGAEDSGLSFALPPPVVDALKLPPGRLTGASAAADAGASPGTAAAPSSDEG